MDADKTLAKSEFEELAKSIFQPLEDLNLELNDNAETSNSQSLDATVIQEDERQLEEIQPVVTRSKTKEQNDKNQEDEEWH